MSQETTRQSKPKIIRVEDQRGNTSYYYATSTTQAKSMHNEGIEARPATDLEVLNIGLSGIKVHGLPAESES